MAYIFFGNQEMIYNLIPHRGDLALLQSAEIFTEDDSDNGKPYIICQVGLSEKLFSDHFKVFPGYLMAEAMAQAGAVLSLRISQTSHGKAIMPALASAEKMRWLLPVRTRFLETKVWLLKSRGNIYKFKGEVRCNGQLVAFGEFTGALVEQP
ncbi:MAG: hypothetical protein WCW02_02250 [Candidatus Buchananbacteria bacterium]